ncbi:MAG: alpha/beta hydrolase [Acetobacteraceae bacterium]|nr:alpha/beta hydrolase [Acetobacteraceae bacterium]
MPDYVITTRAISGSNFSDEPGEAVFLKIPDQAANTAPGQKIPRHDWVREVVGIAGKTKDATGVSRGDVVVFIHGYNNSTEVVLQRHRVLKRDLPKFAYHGAVVSFDWPSSDIALAYLEDREKAKRTALYLVKDGIELFARMQNRQDCEVNVHLLAHSTGAYVVREAFDDADDRRAIAAVNWTTSQIAFIGADLSADSLSGANSSTESLYRHCLRLTNYSNPFDDVLQLSNAKRIGLAPRAGRVGLPGDAPAKAANIDCGEYYQKMIQNRPPGTIIGEPSHSWYIGDPVFTEDLAHTLNGNLDRRAINTRQPLATGQFKLVSPQTFVASAASVPIPVQPARA